MRPLIIYYSLTGSTAKIASHIVEKVKGMERRLVEDNARTGLVASFTARVGLKAKLRSPDYSVGDYDPIILLSPVWTGKPTPAMNAFLSVVDLKGKKVIAVLVGARRENDKAVSLLRSLIISRKALYVETIYLRGLPVNKREMRPTEEHLIAEAERVKRLVEGIINI